MPNNSRVDFFKAPEQLVEVLGSRAEELLTAWFAAAGYLSPRGWHVSLFPPMGVLMKRTNAVDASLSLGMSYYMSEDEETPSVRVNISSFTSKEIQDDPFPIIEIISDIDGGEFKCIFRAGKWTLE